MTYGHAVLAAALITGVGAVGCSAMPDEPVERALYDDLRRIVETSERTGWLIDRLEIDEAAPAALQSVCRVAQPNRLSLRKWLDGRITSEGGPAKEAYERAGQDLSAVGELLTLERARALLAEADRIAADDCPFWLKPDDQFSGIQSNRRRFIVLAESMGSFSTYLKDGEITIGGGGGARIMPAWGVGDSVTIALGAEVGGRGQFSASDDGDPALTAGIAGAIPLLIRFQDLTWFYDIEVAGLTLWRDSKLTWPPGVRVGVSVGISAIRISNFLPYVAGWAGYEFHPGDDEFPDVHTIRIGTRVGFDWDP